MNFISAAKFSKVTAQRGEKLMLQTVEVEIDVNGTVRWLEPVHLTQTTRALVTLLTDQPVAEHESLEGIGASMKANSFRGNPPRYTREELHERR